MDINSDLYINWHLLDGLNHETEYSSAPSTSFHERYPREALLETAYALLSLNRSQYIFRFFGGEPTIHPHFKELVGYISASGRNTRIVLDTNGIRSNRYYSDLLATQSPGSLFVRLSVHCKYAELQKLSYLIALIVERGFFCQVTVNHAPSCAAKAALLFEKLRELRKVLSFSLRLAFPLGGEAAWKGDTDVPGDRPEWLEMSEPSGEASAVQVQVIEEPYACVGVNCVQVSADGVCTLGLKKDDREFAPSVMEEPVLCEGLPHPPTFLEYDEAASSLNAFTRAQLVRELEGGAIRHPLRSDFDSEQLFRMRLKRLPRVTERTIAQYPELWLEHKHELLYAYDFFADEASRQVFLGLVRGQCTGDGAFFSDSAYKAFAHPAIDETLYPYAETATKFCRRIRCLENCTPETINQYLPSIAWYRPAVELVLQETALWLDTLLRVHKVLRGYDFYLGCHNGKHVLYAAPNPPRKRIPLPSPRAADGIPHLSFILPVGDDDRLLTATVESILSEQLVRYEIILVLNDDTLLPTVQDYVRKEPWCIREYRVDDAVSYWQCCDAGLEMAQGEYAVFLRPGCVLVPGVAHKIVKTLKNEECGVVLCGIGKSAILPRKSAVRAFLSEAIAGTGLENTVCKTSLLRSYAIKVQCLHSYDATDLLLQLLHPSKKTAILAQNLANDTKRKKSHSRPYAEWGRETVSEEREVGPGTTTSHSGLSDSSAADHGVNPGLTWGSRSCSASAMDEGTAFAHSVQTIVGFYRAHHLSLASPELIDYVQSRFQTAYPDFVRMIREKRSQGSLDAFLTRDLLSSFAAFPFIAQEIIERQFFPRRGRVLRAETNVLFKSFQNTSAEAFVYTGLAMLPCTPVMTVCITLGGDTSYDTETDRAFYASRIRTLIEGVRFDFECLLVDRSGNAALAADLDDLADVYPTVQVCHIPPTVSQAKTRSLCLTQAQARYVTFIERVERVSPDFLYEAYAAIRRGNPDLILPPYHELGANKRPASVLSAFFEQGLPLTLDTMCINREWLTKDSEADTEANTVSLDAVSDRVFVLALLDRARAIEYLNGWTPQGVRAVQGESGPFNAPLDAEEGLADLESSLAIFSRVLDHGYSNQPAVVQGIRRLLLQLLSKYRDLVCISAFEMKERVDSLSFYSVLLKNL